MFSRFRNLFSKNKTEMDNVKNTEPQTETVAVTGTGTENANMNSVGHSNLEGLNFLKNLVEMEQHDTKSNGSQGDTIASGSVLTRNDLELRKSAERFGSQRNLSSDQKTSDCLDSNGPSGVTENLQSNINQTEKPTDTESSKCENEQTKTLTATETKKNDSENMQNENKNEISTVLTSVKSETEGSVATPETETDSVSDLLKKMKTEVMTLDYLTKETTPLPVDQETSPMPDAQAPSLPGEQKTSSLPTDQQTSSLPVDQETPRLPIDQDQTDNSNTLPVSENDISKTSLIKSWVQENNANFTPPTPYPLTLTASAPKLDIHSSIVVEDLPSEVTTPSPTVDGSCVSGGSSNTSTLDSTTTRLLADPTKIVVSPTGDNGLACNAITGKLSDIAEVAETLDAVIRGIQENSQNVEVESNPSPRDKTMGTLRSTSSEDWQSRSTEDESFVTASEGRTSSFMSCNKSSYDYSEEGDDSTINFEMPDISSPFNMSFDESEHNFRSPSQDANKTPTKLSENGDIISLDGTEVPHTSSGDLDSRHSESVTPTPAENIEYIVDSIPIESETELEVAAIANAAPTNIRNETPVPVPMSKTPEVSLSSNKTSVLDANATPASNGQHNTNANNPSKSTSVAWRRSKYYENITKQTIKGFL